MTVFYDPAAPLVTLGDGQAITMQDAQNGILVTGASGGGKTSGPGRYLRDALLRSPMRIGGMIFYAKNGESTDWIEAIAAAKRHDDIVHITPTSAHQFNPFDWLASWQSSRGGPTPIVSFFEELSSAVNPKETGGGDGSAYWEGAFNTRLASIVHLIQLAGLRVSPQLMQEIADSIPQTYAEGQTDQWKKKSLCWAVIREAYFRTQTDRRAYNDFKICKNYLQITLPMLGFKQRATVDVMWWNVARPLLTQPLRPILGEGTTIQPEDCFQGKIFLLDIPIQEHHDTAKLAAVAFKRCMQLAIMRRSGKPGTVRPAFLWADEAQEFFGNAASEASYQAVARSGGGVTVYLTQNLSSIRDALGSDDKTANVTSNLSTKIFCSNTDETAEWASRLIGERLVNETTFNTGGSSPVEAGKMGDGSRNSGISQHKVMRRFVEPIRFQKLKRGGEKNNYRVEAVVFAPDKIFRGKNEEGEMEDLPYKIASFKQKDDVP